MGRETPEKQNGEEETVVGMGDFDYCTSGFDQSGR